MDKKNKIIFAVTNDLTYDQRMHRICSSLVKTGYEIELVGRLRNNSISLTEKSFRQKRLNMFFQKGKLFYFEYNLRLFFYLLFKRQDAICAIDFDTLIPCSFVSSIRNKILIFDAHEYFTEVPEVVNRKLVKKIWNYIGKKFIPKAKLAYTVGPILAEILSGKFNNDFKVIKNVPIISKQKNAYLSSPETPIILYQGALNEARGLEFAINAMHQVSAELWLVGEGDLSSQLRKLVNDENLDYKVKFLGFCKPEELNTITEKAYIGLNLLENRGLNYFYSLANKFFDYMHSGIPSVCADFPEYKKINDEFNCAILCNADESKIADALNELISNVELYKSLQQNCRIAASVFNWESEEKQLIDYYRKVFK